MAMHQFKAESKKLMDLMINSIYTNREIFLRELISNASDAVRQALLQELDRQRHRHVRRTTWASMSQFDKEARTVTVSDNGIGMTKDDLESNLGTIAQSDSLAFKTENAESRARTSTSSVSSAWASTPRSWWPRRCASSPGLRRRHGLGMGERRRGGLHHRGGRQARATAPTSS